MFVLFLGLARAQHNPSFSLEKLFLSKPNKTLIENSPPYTPNTDVTKDVLHGDSGAGSGAGGGPGDEARVPGGPARRAHGGRLHVHPQRRGARGAVRARRRAGPGLLRHPARGEVSPKFLVESGQGSSFYFFSFRETRRLLFLFPLFFFSLFICLRMV